MSGESKLLFAQTIQAGRLLSGIILRPVQAAISGSSGTPITEITWKF